MPREVKLFAPLPANADQLVKELEALQIPGVRTYSIIGRPGECAGVYVWDAAAPAGHYLHLEITEAQANQIRDAISRHVPVPPEPPAHVKALRDLRVKVNGGYVLTQAERDTLFVAVMELMAEKGFI